MKKEDCYELGYLGKTFKLKGELFAHLDADDLTLYSTIDALFLEQNEQLIPFLIEKIQVREKDVVVKLEEVDSIEVAQELVGSKIYLPLAVLPNLEEGDYYLHELLDFLVIDESLGELGKINRLYDETNQDILGMLYKGKEVLIPLVDDIILSVDKEKQHIQVSLPEGLLELYLED